MPEHLRRYRSDIFNDKYFRLSCDGLSRTITAHISEGWVLVHPSKTGSHAIDPGGRQNTDVPRQVPIRGVPVSRYSQIGNAVPPMLASAIGSSVRYALRGESLVRMARAHLTP